MNLINRTIERLRKVRGGYKAQNAEAVTLRDEESAEHVAEKEKAGWNSPEYSQSRRVELITGRVVENRCVAVLPDAAELEHYRHIRTQLYRRIGENGGKTIMITSAMPREGKTLTAINLGFAMARDFKYTVLLVDCDLKQQNIHKYLGTPGDKGIADYLLNGNSVSELVVWPGVEKLTVISGGNPYQDSSELIASPKMSELVAEMRSRYPERYVIFDAPPILGGADALALAQLVDWIVVVVESGKTSTVDINRALDLLPSERVLGLVLNNRKV